MFSIYMHYKLELQITSAYSKKKLLINKAMQWNLQTVSIIRKKEKKRVKWNFFNLKE